MLILFFIPVFAQEPELGLPGDNLNLYGVLNIFQRSRTLGEFERFLNSPDSRVNNLDLNGDGVVDYIHVLDYRNGPVHDIVLRVDINGNETQDVAVIEVERNLNNQVNVQIVGDEALYGKDYIVESTQPPASWGIVGHLYAPAYVVYESPYHYGYYPAYYQTIVPMSYHDYYVLPRPYATYYSRGYSYAAPAAHSYYSPHRISSVTIQERYHANTIQYHQNHNETPAREHSEAVHQEQQREHLEGVHQEPQREHSEGVHQEPQRSEQPQHNYSNPQVKYEPQSTRHESPVSNQQQNQINRQPSQSVVHQSTQPAKTVVHPSTQPVKRNPNQKK
jgi:hypothetical protein